MLADTPEVKDYREKRQQVEKRWGALRSERASWFPHWQEISNYLLPRAGRFFVQDTNRGQRRYNDIIDDTGTRSLRVLSAGLMSGASSPARPWFRMTTRDPEMAKSHAVKLWLDDVTERIAASFAASNIYGALHRIYEELAAFGTAAAIVVPDDATGELYCHVLTAGEYCLAKNWKGEIDTLYREFQRTVAEVVREFGESNVSTKTRELYKRGDYDSWVTIIHAIEPRHDRDPSKADNLNMPWRSCYFEKGGDLNQGLLRESGFERFPVLAPRWNVTSGDVYGTSPGMEALGAIKQLQHEQIRKAQGIDYQTKPPIYAPLSMKDRDVDMLPGGVTFVDAPGSSQPIKSMWDVRLDLNHLSADMAEVRERIKQTFGADLFLMLNDYERGKMTATEVAERAQERLLNLGPVIDRVGKEAHEPLVEMAFEFLLATGQLPPPPDEVFGQDLKIEFVSMLAQAQRAIQTNSFDRMIAMILSVAQVKTDIMHKLNTDELVDAYAEAMGVDPRIVVPNEQVQKIREAQARAQAAQAQAEMMNQTAQTAQALGNTPVTGDTALTNVLDMFSVGYGNPGGVAASA